MLQRTRRAALWCVFGVMAGGLAGIPAWAENQVFQGEVVDPGAYLKTGAHGADAVDQTYEAVDGGQTLALLEEKTQTLYLFLAEEAGEDPNELVYDYANRKVKVTGSVVERGGLKGIVAASVEPLEPLLNTTTPAPEGASSSSAED